ncbi:adherens junction organization [Homalodisca vitripennis]|nr:adherens junction organization [Homalodisca vitripennis]
MSVLQNVCPAGPRRMSERDLPSRVLSEQQNLVPRGQLPPHAPQIHSSKSVPSLHSGNHELHGGGGVVVGGGVVGRSHEVFNPGYSRTSSTNSIPQRTFDGQPPPNTLRSRVTMDEPCRSSDIREILADQNLSELTETENEDNDAGLLRETFHGSFESLASNNDDIDLNLVDLNELTDFSSGSDDDYIPDLSELEPSERDEVLPGRSFSYFVVAGSSQNLTDHRGSNLPPNGGGNLGGRQASNPSLAQTQPPHPHTAYQQHVHQQQQQLLLQQQQQHQQQQQQHHQQQQQQQQQQHHQQQHQQHQQQNSPSGENGERFYQNLSIYRNQEIQNGFIPQGSGRGKLPSPQDDRSPAQLQKSFRGSQSSLSTGRPPDQSLSRPASAYLPQQATGHHPPHLQQNMAPRSQSSRDMLRQEAKLQEMSEEVRRRELRLTSPQSRLQMPQGPIQGPRPGYPVEPYSNGPGYPHSPRSLKQQESPGGYRESPPPPPPPTSTHPLYQPAPPPPMYQPARYAASMGEPPRGGYYPANNTQPPRPYQFQGTNPWEREEREKEMLMRKEAARQWRDQQIAELTALGANRNQQQEEQLRALRLEKEFERRAEEEAEEEEEEDTESNERVQGLLRVARQQDEKRHAAQTTPSPAPAPAPAPTRPPQQQVNGIIGRTTMPPSNNYPANPVIEEKERLRRLKEMKMKQAEMEAEARLKRRDEELRQQQINNSANLQQQVTPLSSHPRPSPARSNNTPPSHLRLDNLIVNQPAAPGQYNGYSPGQSSPAGAPPQPPERGSSFAVMSQTQGRSPNTPNNNSVGAKRVSFQDASPPSPPTNAAPPLDNIREDPNNFINDAETMLASPTSPDTPFTGNTPGVIGAQEVYKDPRTRRLQEQQNQKMMTAKVPEKLSFKEKMKMFAMETGEDGTPRDKVKISRAQRDIDNIGSPTTPNNNTSVSNNN